MDITKEIYIDGNLIENDFVKLYYKGKFTREFSNEVYIVFGYGSTWNYRQEQKMIWNGECFCTEIILTNNGQLNFCFRNDFNSWDNNDYRNYSVFVEPYKEQDVVVNEIPVVDKVENEVIVEEVAQKPLEKPKEFKREFVKRDKKKEKFKRAISKKDKKSRKRKKFEKNRVPREFILQSNFEEESLFECFSTNKPVEIDAEVAINAIVNSERIKKKTKKKSKKERKKENLKRYKKNKTKNGVRIFCGIVLICCVIYATFYFIELKDVQSQTNLLNTVVIHDSKNHKNGTITFVETERMLQVKELNKQYPELKGWIEIGDTSINYPIMQGKDNSYYMTHDYKKEYSRWGSLFLDKDYDFSVPSSNLLIYGHNFSDGIMFSDLLKYKDKSFFDNHPVIKFTTPEEDVEYEIISVFYSRVYYQSEKNVFRYYYFVNASNENEYNEFVTNAKNASIYDTGKTATYGDQLLTLSTCEYSQEDGRFVVVARKK